MCSMAVSHSRNVSGRLREVTNDCFRPSSLQNLDFPGQPEKRDRQKWIELGLSTPCLAKIEFTNSQMAFEILQPK